MLLRRRLAPSSKGFHNGEPVGPSSARPGPNAVRPYNRRPFACQNDGHLRYCNTEHSQKEGRKALSVTPCGLCGESYYRRSVQNPLLILNNLSGYPCILASFPIALLSSSSPDGRSCVGRKYLAFLDPSGTNVTPFSPNWVKMSPEGPSRTQKHPTPIRIICPSFI